MQTHWFSPQYEDLDPFNGQEYVLYSDIQDGVLHRQFILTTECLGRALDEIAVLKNRLENMSEDNYDLQQQINVLKSA
jgi:hypothetical protein